MNFLDICKRVDTMSGVQGMIQGVENTIGVQSVIVNAVAEGFLDLQVERLNWIFMRRTAKFGTTPGQYSYSIIEAVGPDATTDLHDPTRPYNVFGRWQKKHLWDSYFIEADDAAGNITSRKPLRFIDYRTFRSRFLMSGKDPSVKEGKPTFITAHDVTNELILHPTPDKRYWVYADYFVEPQLLTRNSEVPILPASFHLILVYRGLERLANHYSNPSIYQRYSAADAVMLGNLYRDQVPAEVAEKYPVA